MKNPRDGRGGNAEGDGAKAPFLMKSLVSPDIRDAARLIAGGEGQPHPTVTPALRWHGLVPLVAMRLGGTSPEFERELRAAMAFEIARQREFAATLEALAAAGVEPVIFKGTALAYSVYAAPWLRPRGDVDLLIRKQEKEAALAALVARGYELPPATSGDEVMNQRLAVKRDGAVAHHIDVHWRLSNAPGFADRFGYDELRASSAGIEALGANARRPLDVWSLLIACAHRVAHHRDEERAIWLYDIHLLAESLGRAGIAEAERLARRDGLWSVVVDGLEAAHALFGTELPKGLRAEGDDWSAAFLTRGRSRWSSLLVELRQLPPRRALRLLKEHAFPPAEFMRRRHGGEGAPLAWLYLRRIAGGLRKRKRTIS